MALAASGTKNDESLASEEQRDDSCIVILKHENGKDSKSLPGRKVICPS